MRVVIGYDGSTSADHACDLVAAVAWPAGTELEVVTAYLPNLPGAGWPAAVLDAATAASISDLDRELAEERAQRAAERLQKSGVTVTWSTPMGRPASEILSRAAGSTDLVVVGSRGHGPLAEALLGSVSAELVDHAPCPVLVARRAGIERVIVAEDGSPGAEAAAALIAWPIFTDSLVRVVTVAEGHDDGATQSPASDEVAAVRRRVVDRMRAASTALANGAKERLEKADRRVDMEVRLGDPGHEIVLAATAWNADLIVMGTRGRTGLTRLLTGSVARKVLHHAPCSVLIDRLAAARPAS